MMQDIPSPTPEIKYPTRKPELSVDVEIPADFDLAAFPILSRHWFGISPAAVGVATVSTVA